MPQRASCFGSPESLAGQPGQVTHAGDSIAIRVRDAVVDDRERILALVPGMVESGLPAWREVTQCIAAECESLVSILASPRAGASILVVVDARDQPVGFVHVVTASDPHTRERHGQIMCLVVASGLKDGHRPGRALIVAAERWTRARGYRLLTMPVFAEHRALQSLCLASGLVGETITYRKSVR